MAYLALVLTTLFLTGGFFLVTRYERRRGMRFFADSRTRLDHATERAAFILSNVDLGAFLREEVRHALQRALHAGAQISLRAVRTVERALTRIVMGMRARSTTDPSHPFEKSASAREFVRTLSDFKTRLESTRPELPEIR